MLRGKKAIYTYFRSIFMFLTLSIVGVSTLSAAANSCPGDDIGAGDTQGFLHTSLVGSSNKKDYYKFKPGVAGKATISFTSDKEIVFYIGTRCEKKNILDKTSTSGTTTSIPFDTSRTVYILAQYTWQGGNTDYTIHIDFTPDVTDKITSFTAPSEVTKGETISVSVSYNVSQSREIVAGFQQNHSPWDGWGWKTVTVPAGIGTVNIPVTIPTDQPVGNGYQIPISLQPVGGNWNSRLDSKSQNPVNLIAPVCNGCDCSLDDNNIDNSSPGVVIPQLDGATADVSKCISGTSEDNDKDFYNFTVQKNGQLDISTSSPNGHNYQFKVLSSQNGTLLANNTGQNRNLSYSVSAGEKITIRFKESGNDLDEYQANLDFTAAANEPPVATAQNISVDENSSGNTITLSGDDPDGDNANLAYTVLTAPSHGTLSGTAPNLTYTPTADYHGPDSFTFKVNDGTDDSAPASVSITVNALSDVIIENADDLCYQEPTHSGMMCVDMGMCSGGMGCTNTYPLKNIGDSDLSNVRVIYNETGMGGSFGSNCQVSPSGTCATTHNMDMGPVGMFGSATEFNLTNAIPPSDESNSIASSNFMSMSCFNGNSMYATYTKDGKRYRGKMKLCHAKYECAEPKQFSPAFRTVTSGDIQIIGNTNLCAPKDNDHHNKTCVDPGNTANNYIDAISRDGDNNSETNNSSAAKLELPTGATVLWAGLYWQGHLFNENSRLDYLKPQSEHVKLGYSADLNNKNINYTDIQAQRLNHIYTDPSPYPRWYYQGFKDITSYVKSHGSGWYWGANILTELGFNKYGAWSIAVAYQDDNATVKNLTIYDGFLGIYNNDTEAVKYAKEHKCDESNTGVQKESTMPLSGFLTPSYNKVNSSLILFAGEGDIKYTGDKMYMADKAGTFHEITNAKNPANNIANSTISKNGNTVNGSELYPYLGYNTIGIDIDTFDVGNIMENGQYKTAIKLNSNGDMYFPGVFGLSTELYVPKLCYDYSYEQDSRFLTEANDGSKEPRVNTPLFSSDPVTVSVFIRNKEASDIKVKDMKMHIGPINTAQATYINSTTKIIPPGESWKKSAPKPPLTESDSKIDDIYIGNLGSEEYYYTYYNLHPKASSLDMPLNSYIEFNTTITIPDGGGTFEAPYYLKAGKDLPMCVDGNYSYTPKFGIFNVEEKGLGKYNIRTQVARRVDNFEVTAYDATNTNTPIDVDTAAAVELIDVGSYHDIYTACQEPESALTPRVWEMFNNESRIDLDIQKAIDEGRVSDQLQHKSNPIEKKEDFFNEARRNVAFRISYVGHGDGDLIETKPVTCKQNSGETCYNIQNFPDLVNTDLGNGKGKCAQDMGNPNTIPSHCGNAGHATASALTAKEMAECMECIYGYDVHYYCSRDNFAIRPEAFKVSISDDNSSTTNSDFANNIDKTGTGSSPINIVAGYPYKYEINATSYTDDKNVKGYVERFDESDPSKRAYMHWNPTSISAAQAKAHCNAPVDQNMSFYLVDGTNTNPSPLNKWEDLHDKVSNIGEYEFKVDDEEWTKYDWDESLNAHHTGSHYIDKSTPDCLVNNAATPTMLNTRVGCKISSNNSDLYKAMNIKAYPYKFDITALSAGARSELDTNPNSYVYINTLDESKAYPYGFKDITDEKMSYNVKGTFAAYNYDDKQSVNFVDGCFAKNVDLSLVHKYLSDIPTDGDQNLTYSVVEYNTTNESLITRAKEHGVTNNEHVKNEDSNLTIPHTPANFEKSMKGAITMDLELNFDRDFNKPLNPRLINFNDVALSMSPQPSPLYVDGVDNYTIKGNKKGFDQNITFMYARAKPGRVFYDGVADASVATPVSVVVYCDLPIQECQDRGLQLKDPVTGNLNTQTNESFWWLAMNHNNQTQKDGNIVMSSTPTDALSKTTAAISLGTGEDQDIKVSRSSTATLPLEVPVDYQTDTSKANYTDRWLMYNKNSNEAPTHFYKVRFIGGSSGWTGYGKTGHVVGDEINKKKTRRLEW